jgi:hypothetical protein
LGLTRPTTTAPVRDDELRAAWDRLRSVTPAGRLGAALSADTGLTRRSVQQRCWELGLALGPKKKRKCLTLQRGPHSIVMSMAMDATDSRREPAQGENMTVIEIRSMSPRARRAWGLCDGSCDEDCDACSGSGEPEGEYALVYLADDGRVFWGSFWIGTLRPDQIKRAQRELRLPLTT